MNKLSNDENIITEIKNLILIARDDVEKQVNHVMLITYWNIGKIIVEYEQKGNAKADYGKQLIKNLSKELTKEIGRGFSRSNLFNMRAFYLNYPKFQITSGKLS